MEHDDHIAEREGPCSREGAGTQQCKKELGIQLREVRPQKELFIFVWT